MNAMPLSIDDVTERQLAKAIDHSLLRPELDDDFIDGGCRLAAEYDVASVCVRPTDVARAAELLAGTDVAVGTVVGFPHGSSTTATKVAEAREALAAGADRARHGHRHRRAEVRARRRVAADIGAVVDVAHAGGAIVKVILENAYLTDDEKVRGCRVAEAAGADFVKTSTGFAPGGATHEDLAPDAPHRLDRRPGQGGRRRPHPRRPAGGHGARRDAHRRDSRRSRSSTNTDPGAPARRRTRHLLPAKAGTEHESGRPDDEGGGDHED